MLDLLPRRALFAFELPIHHLARPPRLDGDASKWPAQYLVPPLIELEDTDPIADVYWGWNADGFYAAFDVPNRRGLPEVAKPWWKGDGLRLCIDTRDARDIKRATRFCHFFYVLPLGGGPGGKARAIAS
ncbi:MAG: hypothetical protein AB1716_16260 [Planctomycetota bacterium]